ncbi:MAG: glycosyltransferase family 1 protein [Armatimonadota bacterium]|nr:glycosyltransferase family 1 protein [Armatimonadota bacterium]
MKIGLDARYLTHPQEGGFRTYTQSLIAAIARIDQRNEYVLYTDRPADLTPTLSFEERGLASNFRTRVVSGSLPVREQVALPIALARDRVDVAHFLCNTAPLLITCPFVLTIHDVIPCLPEAFPRPFGSRKTRLLDRYWREVIPLAASRAARIVTVSESSSLDIQRVLGMPAERIDVMHNGIDPSFRTLDPDALRTVLQTTDLPSDRFFLGFLSKEPRKNSVGILRAFKILSERVSDCGLVLVSSSRDDVAIVSESSLRDPRIIALRGVSRDRLVALYNAAVALVFPSYAEGFGLPIVEAMACGAPVITSTAGSLPEVAGDAALLVDPGNTNGIAQAMLAVLTDERLSRSLRTRGLERARRFSWEETARRMVATYMAVGATWRREASRPPAESEAAGGAVGDSEEAAR